jgi:hypothetical protein
MSAPRLQKTLGDYVGIAISPILIMAMVGSLSFFLLEIGYGGEYVARLRWTLFWFVLASVLVSRISIEQGSGVAGIYGFGLAVVTGMMIHRFVGFVVVVWLLLGLIWWCASKLTWDCTLIDDSEDASGAGLLQVAGLDDSAKKGRIEEELNAPEAAASERGDDDSRQAALRPVSWWRRILQNRSEREGQPHAPGLWVVYFSLIALPVFGVGQLMIPQTNTVGRRYGFALLLVYVATALGLLLMTSFLGLRRYLRQRHLQMPPAMAATWVTLGITLASAILLACTLLPRPNATYSLTALVEKIGSPEQRASERSIFTDESADGSNPRTGRRGERDGEGNLRSSAGGGGENSGQGDRDGSSTAGAPSSSSALTLANLLKWVIYALLVAFILYILWRHWAKLMATLKQMWQEFLNFWRALFGLKTSEPSDQSGSAAVASSVTPPRPFSAFRNPFASGKVDRMSLAELIVYSFEALQAWARDAGHERRPEQTPYEFARLLSEVAPVLSNEALETTRAYGRLAYAGQLPPAETIQVLERLWQQMNEPNTVEAAKV